MTHQRAFVIYVFAYFRCNFENVDPEKLANVLEIDREELIELIEKLITQFIGCLGELAASLASMGSNNNNDNMFEEYLLCYTQNGNKFIIMDQLGLKLTAILFDKLLIPLEFSETIFCSYVCEKATLLTNSDSE